MCNSNNCPAGIATQKPELRARLDVEHAAARLQRLLQSSIELMKVMARVCGHDHLNGFNPHDLGTWKEEMARLSGVACTGLETG